MKIVFTVIIAVMQAFIVIIPLKGKLSDNRHKFPKNFTRLGYSLIVCCFITLACTIILYFLSEEEEKAGQELLQYQLRNRDSVHQNLITEANKHYIVTLDSSNKATMELLAKYGLKYDSSQKVIAKLVRDSSKRSTTIIRAEDPELSLCPENGITDVFNRNDTLLLKLRFCSSKSTSRIEILKLTTVIAQGDYMNLKPDNIRVIDKNRTIQDSYSQVESSSATVIQMRYPNVLNANMVYVRIHGTYTNVDKTKKFKVDILHGYDIRHKQYGSVSPILSDRIRALL
jgi:hypothetical protein